MYGSTPVSSLSISSRGSARRLFVVAADPASIRSDHLSATRILDAFAWRVVLTSVLLLLSFVLVLPLAAKPVAIATTGYTLTLPDTWNPEAVTGAPDILLQYSASDKTATIQVVKGAPGSALSALAADYEARMRTAMPGFSLLRSSEVVANGKPSLVREYTAPDRGRSMTVLSLFYSDGRAAFVVHALGGGIDTTAFTALLTSIAGPVPGQIPDAPPSPAVRAQALGETGYALPVPVAWKSLTAERPDSVLIGTEDRTFRLEVAWKSGFSDFMMEIMAQASAIEVQNRLTGSGSWTKADDASGREGGRLVIQRRFTGSRDGVPSEVIILVRVAEKSLFSCYAAYPQSSAEQMRPAALAALSGMDKAETVAAAILKASAASPSPAPAAAQPPAPPAAPPTTQAASPQSPLARYVDPGSGIGVSYPATWVPVRSGKAVTIGGIRGGPDYETTINLQTLDRSLPANRDLDTAYTSFVEGIRRAGGRIERTNLAQPGGLQSYRIELLAVVDGLPYRYRYYLIERAAVMQLLSFVAPLTRWNAYLPLVERLETTIRSEP